MRIYDWLKTLSEHQLADILCLNQENDCEHCPYGKRKPEDYPGLCTEYYLEQEMHIPGVVKEDG